MNRSTVRRETVAETFKRRWWRSRSRSFSEPSETRARKRSEVSRSSQRATDAGARRRSCVALPQFAFAFDVSKNSTCETLDDSLVVCDLEQVNNVHVSSSHITLGARKSPSAYVRDGRRVFVGLPEQARVRQPGDRYALGRQNHREINGSRPGNRAAFVVSGSGVRPRKATRVVQLHTGPLPVCECMRCFV